MKTVEISKDIKFIIMTGGVLSGLGKGVSASSIALLLDDGLKKIPIKCDGYLNYDPGNLNISEHGEVFVLEDGTQVDMDFGHYERFLGISCNGTQNITMGKIYKEIIDLERKGEFLGKTVKLMPEVSDYIENKILKIAKENKANIVLLEIGGTVGDLENELYLVAAKGLKKKLGEKNVCFVHLAYLPEITPGNEQKTKPVQNSVSELLKRGIIPDILICRSKHKLEKIAIEKLSDNCGLLPEQIISASDVKNICQIPLNFKNQNLDKIILKKINIKPNKKLNHFVEAVEKIEKKNKESVKIGLCSKDGKNTEFYVSVIEAINHVKTELFVDIEIILLDSNNYKQKLKEIKGIIISEETKLEKEDWILKIIKEAKKNKIPFLGLNYGMAYVVIESIGKEAIKNLDKKNLGKQEIKIIKNTKIYEIYKNEKITERQRNKFEIDIKYLEKLKKNGIVVSGFDKSNINSIELKDHPFFIGIKASPELNSKILKAHPLFVEFIKKVKEKKKRKEII